MNENETNITENEETKWVTISFNKEDSHEFTGKDGKAYTSVNVGDWYSFIRPTDKIPNETAQGVCSFSVPSDYNFTLQRSVKDDEGKYGTEEMTVTAGELFGRMEAAKEKAKYVNISVSKKRVVSTFPVATENGSKEYSKILAPGGISYIRPTEKIKDSKYDENYVYFSLLKDKPVKCQRRTDEVIGKTEQGKDIYKTEEFEMMPSELKELYTKEKEAKIAKENKKIEEEPAPFTPTRGRSR